MGRYIKKAVEVEAFHFTKENIGISAKVWPEWLQDAYANDTLFHDEYKWYIRTLEGNHEAKHGDYIIQGVKGELYPCKPDIFELTYDLVH